MERPFRFQPWSPGLRGASPSPASSGRQDCVEQLNPGPARIQACAELQPGSAGPQVGVELHADHACTRPSWRHGGVASSRSSSVPVCVAPRRCASSRPCLLRSAWGSGGSHEPTDAFLPALLAPQREAPSRGDAPCCTARELEVRHPRHPPRSADAPRHLHAGREPTTK